MTLQTVRALLYGMGDQHLDIVVSKLKERYKVDVELSKPKVAFRETTPQEFRCRRQSIRNSPADTDSMAMLRCALSHPAIWRHRMYLSR